MLTLWRLTKARYAAGAFSGDGAWQYGGRWTPPGWRAVYCASSRALAVLEIAVHLPPTPVAYEYVFFAVRVPDDLVIATMPPGTLPPGWDSLVMSSELHGYGLAWLETAETSVLEVPSAVIPAEKNYVLNPAHPDFGRLEIGDAETYVLDRRLAR